LRLLLSFPACRGGAASSVAWPWPSTEGLGVMGDWCKVTVSFLLLPLQLPPVPCTIKRLIVHDTGVGWRSGGRCRGVEHTSSGWRGVNALWCQQMLFQLATCKMLIIFSSPLHQLRLLCQRSLFCTTAMQVFSPVSLVFALHMINTWNYKNRTGTAVFIKILTETDCKSENGNRHSTIIIHLWWNCWYWNVTVTGFTVSNTVLPGAARLKSSTSLHLPLQPSRLVTG